VALIQAQHVGWIPSQNKIGEGIVDMVGVGSNVGHCIYFKNQATKHYNNYQ